MYILSKKILFIVLSVLIISAGKIHATSSPSEPIVNLIEDALTYGTDPIISVGLIQGNESSHYVYQADQVIEEGPLIEYEVGSITKTLTASMLAQAVDEGLVHLDHSFSQYLPSLDSSHNYPTIRQLLTHQSGYPTLFDNETILENIRLSLNPYHGVTRNRLLEELVTYSTGNAHTSFGYSNVNAAILGLVLESVYQQPYESLVKEFMEEELALNNSYFFESSTDLRNQWEWSADDVYAPAAAMVSNIEDMLTYSQVQLDEDKFWLKESHSLLAQGAQSSSDSVLRQDKVAYHWFYDEVNDVYWHDGGTGGYTSYIGFNIEKDLAVVVLSNIPMDEGIPANVIGSQMMDELIQQSSQE